MNINTLKKEDAVATDLAAQQPLLAIRDLRKQFTRANGTGVVPSTRYTVPVSAANDPMRISRSSCSPCFSSRP